MSPVHLRGSAPYDTKRTNWKFCSFRFYFKIHFARLVRVLRANSLASYIRRHPKQYRQRQQPAYKRRAKRCGII